MEDEPYIDYHEVVPTKWEMTAAYAICCAKCHETKLAKYFRRPLTRAQATARGYKGMSDEQKKDLPRHLRGDRLMTVESKYCSKCQPGRYKPSEMSKKAIHEAAYNGRVPHVRAITDAEVQHRKAGKAIANSVAKRWAHWRATPWLHIREKISVELEYLRQALNYYKKSGEPKFGQLSEFMEGMRATLHAAQSQCSIYAKTQRKVDETLTWRTLLGAAEYERLEAAWQALPVGIRSRLRRIPEPLNSVGRGESLFADWRPPTKPNERKPEPGSVPEQDIDETERLAAIAELIREQAAKRKL